MAAIAVLSDDFNDNAIDSGKWTATTGVVEQRQRLTILPTSVNQALTSISTYDLTNSSAFVELPVASDGASAVVYLEVGNTAGSDSWAVRWNAAGGPALEFIETVGGVESATSVTYDSTSHRWLCIRHAGTTLFWETSVNGLDWTTRRSKTPNATIDKTAVKVWLAAFDVASAATVAAEFDNFNVFPPQGGLYRRGRMQARAY